MYSTFQQDYNLEEEKKCTWSADADPETSPHKVYDWQRTQKVFSNILEAIGNTPFIKLNKIPESCDVACDMFVKCEYMNPGGSEHDRFGYRAILEGERTGDIQPGDTLIVPSAGNTGVSLALVAAVKGYPIKIVCTDDISQARQTILKMLGAEVIKVSKYSNPDSADGLFGVCRKLNSDNPNSKIISLFDHRDNPLSHYDGTAEEILDALDGQIDMVVVPCISGGLATGVGRKLRERCPGATIVTVDRITYNEEEQLKNLTPEDNYSLYSDNPSLTYQKLPSIMDSSVIDKWAKCDIKDGFIMARRLINEEGLFCGVISGTTVHVAVNEAKSLAAGAKCVVILTDSIRDHMSKFICDAWMEAKCITPCNNPKDYWWWDINVSELRLKPVQTIEETSDCHKAIHIMKKYKISQLPVVSRTNNLIGAVTLASVLNKILSGEAHSKDPVSKIYSSDVFAIEEGFSATLGLMTRTLEIQPFVVLFKIANGDLGFIRKTIGVVTPEDILLYIQANNPKKC